MEAIAWGFFTIGFSIIVTIGMFVYLQLILNRVNEINQRSMMDEIERRYRMDLEKKS